MTGRVNILWRMFEKIAKKLKMKSQEWKKTILILPVVLSFMKFVVAQNF